MADNLCCQLQGHQDQKEVKEFLGHLDHLDSQAPGDQWDPWAHLQIYPTLNRADGAPWSVFSPPLMHSHALIELRPATNHILVNTFFSVAGPTWSTGKRR